MKIEPADALIVVDVQCDFCADGALPVPNGDDVVPVINDIINLFDHHFFSRDWHPANHCSFSATPEYCDGSWPAHCVQDTEGAMFNPGLTLPADAVIIDTATSVKKEAYSAFMGTKLAQELKKRDVNRVFVCGLALDYCVKATALDAVTAGFTTILVTDGCRGIDSPKGNVAAALDALAKAGVLCCVSDDLERV